MINERRPVDACRRDAADGVAEAGSGVHEHERRLTAAERVSGRHSEHRPLVQPEDEAEVVGEPGKERHLGRAGVREDRRQATTTEDLERRVTNGACHDPQTSSATSTIKASFAHCSSSVSVLPSTVEEKPHCGDRQSCSIGA